MKNIAIARKSIVAKTKILKGEKFSYKNLTFKRPGTGISPMKINKILKTKSKINYEKDDLIKIWKKKLLYFQQVEQIIVIYIGL